MWLGSLRPSVSLLAHLDLTAETAPELNREPLAVEREPDDHRTGCVPSRLLRSSRPGRRNGATGMRCSGHPLLGPVGYSAREPAASLALAARL